MGLKQMKSEAMDWITLAQNEAQSQRKKAEDLLGSCATVIFSWTVHN